MRNPVGHSEVTATLMEAHFVERGCHCLYRSKLVYRAGIHLTLPPLADILVLASTGFRISPCREKRPITKNGSKDANADPGQIKAWWTQ